MDKHTPAQRSYNMSRVRSSGSKLEKSVFTELRKNGIHFQKNYRKAFGNPDIAQPKKQKAVFIHSDFWHGWQYPRWEHTLSSDFWKDKIHKNKLRDRKVSRTLKQQGWKTLTIWEHSLKKDPEKTIGKIIKFLR